MKIKILEIFNLNYDWKSRKKSNGKTLNLVDGNDHIGSAIKFSAEPAQINTKLPAIGEQTAQILDELDLTEADHTAILDRL